METRPEGRIPGGEQVRMAFGDCFEPLRNNTYSRAAMSPTMGVANIHYGDVLVKYGDVLDFGVSDVPSLLPGTTTVGDELRDGDVVIADTAEDETCGKGVEIAHLGSRKAVAGLHTIACRPKPGLFVPGWLGYYINSVSFHRQLVRLMAGSKVLSISRAALQGTTILVPSLSEQRRTVAVLSSCDRLIGLKRKLLEEKKAQKRALVQRLLDPTGGDAAFSRVMKRKTRPGGRIPRPLSPLSAFLEFKNGINAPKEQFGSGIKLISVREVLDEQPIRYDSIRASVEVPAEMVEAYSVGFGDVLFQRSSENAQEAGSCNVYLDAKAAVFGGFVIRGKKKVNYAPVFFRALLQSQFVRRQIVARAAGAQHFNIGQEDLESIMIPIFGQEEQHRIAAVLSAADREIDGLAREVQAWKEKKKALSQLLLSGKVRV